jgi:hypothetical protein
MDIILIKDYLWPIVSKEHLQPERPAPEIPQWDSDA